MTGIPIPKDMLYTGQLDIKGLADLDKATPTESDYYKWRKARIGKITGSQFHKVNILTRNTKTGKKGEYSQGYLEEILAECITGEPQDDFSSPATVWGSTYEPEAIRLYSQRTGRTVYDSTFTPLDGSDLIGCTVDGFVGDNGVLEVKCPYKTKNHVRTILTNKIPAQYMDQVNGHLLCTGRKWCDFVSYDPRCRVSKMVIIRHERNEEQLQALKERLLGYAALLEERKKELGL